MKLARENGYSILRIYQPDIFSNKLDWKTYLSKLIKVNKPSIVYLSLKDKYKILKLTHSFYKLISLCFSTDR